MDEMENSRNLPVPLTGSETADAPDWKQQLDRLEAKADRNGRLLRICIGLLVALIAVLAIGFGVLFYHGSIATRVCCRPVTRWTPWPEPSSRAWIPWNPASWTVCCSPCPRSQTGLPTWMWTPERGYSPDAALMQLLQELQQEVSQITGFFNGFGGLFR